jgi:hypothetical protein
LILELLGLRECFEINEAAQNFVGIEKVINVLVYVSCACVADCRISNGF